jgi:hypothetical protein
MPPLCDSLQQQGQRPTEIPDGPKNVEVPSKCQQSDVGEEGR